MDVATFNHTQGQPREISAVSNGTHLRFFIDGGQIKLNAAGYRGVPVPSELRGSTLHGFAVDTHCVEPYAAAASLPAVLEFDASAPDDRQFH